MSSLQSIYPVQRGRLMLGSRQNRETALQGDIQLLPSTGPLRLNQPKAPTQLPSGNERRKENISHTTSGKLEMERDHREQRLSVQDKVLLFNQERKKKRKVTLPVLRYGGYKWCIPVNCHLTVGIKVYQNLKKKRQGEKILLIHGTANITHILKLDANTSQHSRQS